MTYPNISQYTQALENAKEQLRTIKDLKMVRDTMGEPTFRSSNGSVLFSVTIRGRECTLRLFTTPAGRSMANGTIKEHEIYVMGKNGGDYYDLVIEEPKEDDTAVHKIDNRTIVASENRIAFEQGGKWGFMDNNLRIVIKPQYDTVNEFSEGRTVVSKDGMHGLIDKDGKVIIELIYDEMSYDGSHLCYVECMGACGVLDRLGRTVVELVWHWTSEFENGFLLVERNQLYGYVNLKGEVVIEPKYDNATSFDENLYATVTLDGREFQIDPEQNRL